jgi:hypothetical protein
LDIRLPNGHVPAEELAYPDEATLAHDEPAEHYEGDCNVAMGRSLAYLFNPFVKDDNYYYQLEIPANFPQKGHTNRFRSRFR